MRIVLSSASLAQRDPRVTIDERLARGETASLVYVVPTRRMVTLLRRRWVLATPGRAASHLPLYTIADLAAALAGAALPPRRRIDEDLQTALIDRVMHSLGRRLEHFSGAHATRPGTLATIRNTITALKERGILPPAVEQAEPDGVLPSAVRKMREIGMIYAAYEERLHGTMWDDAGMLAELNAALRTTDINDVFDRAIPGWREAGDRLVTIEGFSEFRPPERELLQSLLKLRDTRTAIVCDYGDANEHLFGHLRESIDALQLAGFRHRVHIEDPKTRWKALVQGTFFTPVRPENRPAFDRITVASAASPVDEASLIARIIRAALRERPDRELSRICVATRMSSTHADLLREALDDAGIPANVTDRFPLAQTSIAIGFLALLDVRLRDFRTRDVARALSSPYYQIAGANGAVDVATLLDMAGRLRIAGGYDQWKSALEVYRAAVAEADDRTPEDIEDEQRRCTSALRDLEIIHALLEKDIPRKATATEFAEHARGLLRTLDTRRAILAGARVARRVEHLERETRAYRALTDVLGTIAEVLVPDGADEPISLDAFVRGLRAAVSGTRFNVRPRAASGVLVTAVEETRGLDIDIMILAGMNDGAFPPPYAPEVFLRGDLALSRDRHAKDERYLFYQGITTWRERLYVTYSDRDEGGRETPPSPFVQEILARADVATDVPADVRATIVGRSDLVRDAGARLAAHGAVHDGWPVEDQSTLDRVARGVAIEQRRHADGAAPEFAGIVGHNDTTEPMLRVRNRPISATRLEAYGRCPFKYFAQRVLRLNAPADTEEGLTALEGGVVVHAILYKFLIRRRDAGRPPIARCGDEVFREATEELYALASDEVERLRISHPFWRADIDRALGLRDRSGALARFLEAERRRDPSDVPAYFEVHFGEPLRRRPLSDPVLSREEPVAFDDWSLTGGIDRIDLGAHDAVILDYKTGQLPSAQAFFEGTNMQLPLYMLAARVLLGDRERPVTAGLLYQVKRDGDKTGGIVPKTMSERLFGSPKRGPKIPDAEAVEAILETAMRSARACIDGIEQGNFPLAEESKRVQVCRSCSFRPVCRVSDDIAGPLVDNGNEEQS